MLIGLGVSDVGVAQGNGMVPGPIKLNRVLPSGGNVANHQISPDGTFVIYAADQDQDTKIELFYVPISGGTAVEVSGGLRLSSRGRFEISPDSKQVVFEVESGAGGNVLFTAPIDLSSPAMSITPPLNGVIPAIETFKITPDGNEVVFIGTLSASGFSEIYSVPIDGSGAWRRLNPPLTPGGDIETFKISPDSSRVVYFGDQVSDNVSELFSVPIAGGRSERLNGALVPGTQVEGVFLISEAGDQVVYAATEGLVSGEVALYRAPIDGAAPNTKLSANSVNEVFDRGSAYGLTSIQGSEFAVYHVRDASNNVSIYSSPLSGQPVQRKLTPSLALVDLSASTDSEINLVSGRLIYKESGTILYSVPVDASAPRTEVANISSGDISFVALDPFVGRFAYSVKTGVNRPKFILNSAMANGTNVVTHADFSDIDRAEEVVGHFTGDGNKVIMVLEYDDGQSSFRNFPFYIASIKSGFLPVVLAKNASSSADLLGGSLRSTDLYLTSLLSR